MLLTSLLESPFMEKPFKEKTLGVYGPINPVIRTSQQPGAKRGIRMTNRRAIAPSLCRGKRLGGSRAGLKEGPLGILRGVPPHT